MHKLTINVPDELHRRARATAALRGQTITEVLRGALEKYVSLDDEDMDAADAAFVEQVMKKIRSGEVKTVPHDEFWAEIEAAEKRGELPD
jgi:predicted DNA-binding protein